MKLHPKKTHPKNVVIILCASCFTSLGAEAISKKDGLLTLQTNWHLHPALGFLCPICEQKFLDSVTNDFTVDDMGQNSLAKDKEILGALEQHPAGISATQLSYKTGIARTTCLKRLKALEDAEKIEREDRKFFLKKVSPGI